MQKKWLGLFGDDVGSVVGDDAARKLDDIYVSNDIVSRRINEISQNIKEQVVDEIKKSYVIPLDQSTDVSQYSQLLVFVRYVHEGNFKEEFLFASLLNSILELKMC